MKNTLSVALVFVPKESHDALSCSDPTFCYNLNLGFLCLFRLGGLLRLSTTSRLHLSRKLLDIPCDGMTSGNAAHTAIKRWHALSSCSNSRFSLMALACSRLIRPVMPRSVSIFRRCRICSEEVSRPLNSFDHTLRIPQATTRDYHAQFKPQRNSRSR